MMLLVVVFLLGYFASRMFSTEGFNPSDWQDATGNQSVTSYDYCVNQEAVEVCDDIKNDCMLSEHTALLRSTGAFSEEELEVASGCGSQGIDVAALEVQYAPQINWDDWDCTADRITITVPDMKCDISEISGILGACGDALTDDYQGQEDCNVRNAWNTASQQSDCGAFRVLGELAVDKERCKPPPQHHTAGLGLHHAIGGHRR